MRVAHLHVGPVHPILEVELQGEERQGVQGLPGGGGFCTALVFTLLICTNIFLIKWIILKLFFVNKNLKICTVTLLLPDWAR